MKITWEHTEFVSLLKTIDCELEKMDESIAICQAKVDAEQAEWDRSHFIVRLLTTSPKKRRWLEWSENQDDLHQAQRIRRRLTNMRLKVAKARLCGASLIVLNDEEVCRIS